MKHAPYGSIPLSPALDRIERLDLAAEPKPPFIVIPAFVAGTVGTIAVGLDQAVDVCKISGATCDKRVGCELRMQVQDVGYSIADRLGWTCLLVRLLVEAAADA
jgi:hypothetical protein